MKKDKACKSCKLFVEGNVCPVCKKNIFSSNWQGKIYMLDTKNSRIANEIGIKEKGEYAIKVN
jgi:RNA polymerase subunit RPABC4/transcription elongation factor Spt4